MKNIMRPAPFVLLSSNHGSMIVNRNDFAQDKYGFSGVGYQLLTTSSYEQEEIDFVLALLGARLKHFGSGVIGIDCGANIGVHTIEWARFMHGWGHVVAFEAQEKIYYALAGNIALNNCLNVNALNSAVGAECGHIDIPQPDYLRPGSFGSFELQESAHNQDIGQPIDYSNKCQRVDLLTLDSLNLDRVDLIKIDVEGMEEQTLLGACDTLRRHRPLLFIEILKTDPQRLEALLAPLGYRLYSCGINTLAVHADDPICASLRSEGGRLYLD
ncbi:FkbM family methyltransferase [Paludibacterium yongneupense]|uniref:FkbM family methyltransferase n=1 Tax=Paludibacterium yongneupense TaxID=400061 RepID=UPI0004051AC4|nr:FkbM family methyltransferase [Paludibacterium yongneupense]